MVPSFLLCAILPLCCLLFSTPSSFSSSRNVRSSLAFVWSPCSNWFAIFSNFCVFATSSSLLFSSRLAVVFVEFAVCPLPLAIFLLCGFSAACLVVVSSCGCFFACACGSFFGTLRVVVYRVISLSLSSPSIWSLFWAGLKLCFAIIPPLIVGTTGVSVLIRFSFWSPK